MAISREDKKDVKGAMGKAIANKVHKVTMDGKTNLHIGGKTSHPFSKRSSDFRKAASSLAARQIREYEGK